LNWRHERLREQNRHLGKWWRRYAASLSTENGGNGGGVVRIGGAHVWQRPLRIHALYKHVSNEVWKMKLVSNKIIII
jgi:hypothetical protein